MGKQYGTDSVVEYAHRSDALLHLPTYRSTSVGTVSRVTRTMAGGALAVGLVISHGAAAQASPVLVPRIPAGRSMNSNSSMARTSANESTSHACDVPVGYAKATDVSSVLANLADANGIVNVEEFFAALRSTIPSLSNDAGVLAEAAFSAVRREGAEAWPFLASVNGRFDVNDSGDVYLIVEAKIASEQQVATERLMSFCKAMDGQFKKMGVWVGATLDAMPVVRFIR